MVSIFQSVNESRDNEDQSSSRTRKYSKDRTRPLTSEEEERLLGDSLGGRGVITSGLSVHTLSSGQGTGTLSSQGNTLNSVKSVRNYKRARPASTLNGDPLGAKKAGLCESEPHVYKVINRELILHKLLLAHGLRLNVSGRHWFLFQLASPVQSVQETLQRVQTCQEAEHRGREWRWTRERAKE